MLVTGEIKVRPEGLQNRECKALVQVVFHRSSIGGSTLRGYFQVFLSGSYMPDACECLVCLQVIMIECADLKNVINYQEVEALKHTIKVPRREGERRDHVAADP